MKKKQILIVEDERIVVDDIKISLGRLGYDVCGTADSGLEAIKKAKEMRPDIILMDIVLKGKMDGIEAAQKIRTRFDIPVIYLTAYADAKTLARAKVTEPFGYILKPFEDRDVHSSIEMCLYRNKMNSLLKESEMKYRGVVENAHDAIYIKTSNSLQYVNPAFERLTGFKEKELCREEFNFWDIVYPDDIKIIKGKAKIRGKKEPGCTEFRIRSKNKRVKIVEANTVNLWKDGEVNEMGILRDITRRKKAEEKLKKSLETLQNTFVKMIDALVSTLERRDPFAAGHQKRVAHLACEIAGEMGLSKGKIQGIRMAGSVHDIGKIQVPAEILIKPEHLSDIEFIMIKMHPQVGYDILKEIEFPYPVARIILQHHERIDGSGYPESLSGDQILLEAKILAVADVIEAMSSHRPYRPSLGISSALEEVKKYKGRFYEPEVVDACFRLFYEKKIKLL
jgi:PAS domain S-box-containing protein/putative nucleotidyltransferase with HDIG domain